LATPALLILDACVLIDFWDADPSAITLVTRHVGAVHIAENVLSEVKQVDRSEAAAAGLIIVEPSLEMMTAAASRRKSLSFQDHLCLLLAKERTWTCISNDGRLRAACSEEGVSVLWGLQVLAEVVAAGGLPVHAAIELAERMAAGNPYLTPKVIERFVALIKSPRRGRTKKTTRHE
jgi:hypothetical protein